MKAASIHSQSKFGKTVLLIALTVAIAGTGFGQMIGDPDYSHTPPPELKHVGIEQRLGEQVPLNLQFQDETGKTVKLGGYFQSGRPVILNLVYYQCPMLCGEVLQGLTAMTKIIGFMPGKQFEILTVSIDPRETPQLAAAKKKTFMERLGRPGAENGWHFLVGKQPEIDALANALGWEYQYDAKTDQFAHAAGVILATPEGKIAQYYYGVEYSARDMRLGIVEASKNRIGTLTDQLLLYCYHYDPRIGKYGAVVTNMVRLGGALTLVILGGFLIVMYLHEPRAKGFGTGRA
ncbi:MAG: SCO family protein [Terriglobia bacterium]|nr:SCO family protein [Terriglobia bacterium]